MSYMEANAKENEATSSREIRETSTERKADTDKISGDRSKFKKVEMSVFTGDDLDSRLFYAERYFQIHKLYDSQTMLVSTISFDGPTFNWYRSQEEREKFVS